MTITIGHIAINCGHDIRFQWPETVSRILDLSIETGGLGLSNVNRERSRRHADLSRPLCHRHDIKLRPRRCRAEYHSACRSDPK